MVARLAKIGLGVLAGIIAVLVVIGMIVYFNQNTILVQVKKLANEKLNGKLEVSSVRFSPFTSDAGLGLSLMDVRLQDSLFQEHHTYTLKAERISFLVDFTALLKGAFVLREVVFRNGEINAFIRKDGYSNLSLIRSSSKDSSQAESRKGGGFGTIEKVRLQNLTVQYNDSVKEKFLGANFRNVNTYLAQEDSVWRAQIKGGIDWKGLVFNPSKGGFLVNRPTTVNFKLAFNFPQKQLKIDPSYLWIAGGDKIELGGEIRLSEKPGWMDLRFKSQDIQVERVLMLLPAKLARAIRKIGILPKVSAEANVVGRMGGGTPVVNVGFKTDTFHYELPIGTLKDMRAIGSFTNKADPAKPVGDANSRISGKGITGLFETFPVRGELVVNNFENPQTVIDCSLKADPASANALFDSSRYHIRSGLLDLDFHYDGSLNEFYNKKLDRMNGVMLGKIALKNVALTYLPQNVHISQLNGRIDFSDSYFRIPQLRLWDGQNRLILSGKADALIPYLFGSPTPVKAFMHIKIPQWQVNWIETLSNLKKANQRNPSEKNEKRVSELIDRIIDDMQIEASLESDQLSYRKLKATRIRGRFTLAGENVDVKSVSMNAFGGNVMVSGGIRNPGSGSPPSFYSSGKISDADIHSVFYSLDNFGQKTMTEKNINGKLNASFDFESQLKNDARIVPSSMKGNLKVRISDGQIVDFEPFMKMKKMIFRKRRLEDVRFATLSNEFVLQGEEVEVKKMEIESNIMTLFVEGIYSFGNKTDLSIQIPFSNLKARDSTYRLAPQGVDSVKGPSIFLRAVDNQKGEVNFKLAFRNGRNRKDP